jgi:flagellar hook-associated protein 1 FlgK
MSILLGLNTAVRALLAQQQAINTTAHNIANANTPGFSRQQAMLAPTDPFTVPGSNRTGLAQQIGTGVTISEIRRIRDQFLDVQFRQRNELLGYWETASRELSQMENTFSEPTEHGLGYQMSQFFNRWRDLSNDPRNVAVRLALREEASNLAAFIRDAYAHLKEQQAAIDERVVIQADQINSISDQINALNDQITKVVAVGDTPNDLMDRRDLLIDDLSKLVKITKIEIPTGSVSISVGGIQLVGPGYATHIDTPLVNGYHDLQWADGTSVSILGGELKALLDMRDVEIPDKLVNLEALADGLIDTVNAQHRTGYGLGGAADNGLDFFGNLDGTAADTADTDNAAKIDIAALIRAFNGENRIAASSTLAGVPGDSSNANSIASLQFGLLLGGSGAPVTQSNSSSDSANLTGIYTGTAPMSFVVRVAAVDGLGRITSVEVSTDGGSTFGAAVAVTSNAASVGNGLTITFDAAGTANTVGDTFGFDRNSTFEDFYRGMIATLGVQSQEAARETVNQQSLVRNVQQARDSAAGVSLDEEATNMVKFQRAYEAAARLVTTLDEMLDTLINRTGTVGR